MFLTVLQKELFIASMYSTVMTLGCRIDDKSMSESNAN